MYEKAFEIIYGGSSVPKRTRSRIYIVLELVTTQVMRKKLVSKYAFVFIHF